MLPASQKLLFAIFALLTVALGAHAFVRLYRRIARGQADTDARLDHLPQRLGYALVTTLTQSRTFRKRRWVSLFHSFIFYGFVFYILVNAVDALDGFHRLSFASLGVVGNAYVLCADVLSALVLLGVVALVLRRFLLPARRDFRFNERTLLHPDVKLGYITRDSIIVSAFILFHVGSRAVGAAAKLAVEGPDRYAPFATLLSHLIAPQHAEVWRVFGYWGALGSVLAFLAYFPRSKHVHIFLAPAKYVVARSEPSGVLPLLDLGTETDTPALGAEKLEDLAWPRLLDAYACIQCNRCQDVCPATATGKSLSPSALEINKRMELNTLARTVPAFEAGAASPRPLLDFALTVEATWGCTTCGACLDICPVQDEPMLDIIDIRRQQVMIAGEFPAQLGSAFRGMERAKNPWGIAQDKRLDWAAGLRVPTTDEKPEPDVLYWVGCAASYDPQAQKTARSFVQLLDHAGVDFAVLGKRECCTGDSARRAGNEYLYRQLADSNVATLNEIRPKLIVATCPHCMNSVGKEYKQIGGDYKVMHHTEYVETLVAAGKLAPPSRSDAAVTYHDPCYLGRHNGVYDAPRNLLNVISNSVVELDRTRENSFCCGAGGAQFWKEEEPGAERISDNRYREAAATLEQTGDAAGEKVLAVGCPFCKSMLESTPGKGDGPAIAIKDVAELLWESVSRQGGLAAQRVVEPVSEPVPATPVAAPMAVLEPSVQPLVIAADVPQLEADVARKKWTPKTKVAAQKLPASQVPAEPAAVVETTPAPVTPAAERKKWVPRPKAAVDADGTAAEAPPQVTPTTDTPVTRKKWTPKAKPLTAGDVSPAPDND